MTTILCFDTATQPCSVALARDGILVSYRRTDEAFSHAEKLNVFIKEVLDEAGVTVEQLDAVAVSKGPGSYTGLRIGVSTAKGICYGVDCKLIAINTLDIITQTALVELQDKKYDYLIPMIDARRMEIYTMVYNNKLELTNDVNAKIIDSDSYKEISDKKVYFFGDGAEKCVETFEERKSWNFINAITPDAKNMLKLAQKAFENDEFEDVAYFEPYYLKDFVAIKPKIKGLR